jgi:chromosome partitioning protein
MSQIIAIANQKGGVSKTTTSHTMAAGLKQRGYRVLALDMDPQGNLSDNAGADNYDCPTMYELLKKEVVAEETIQHLSFDIIPANILLAGTEQELNKTGKEYRLQECIENVQDRYDYIIIDTPPSLGILTINAFTAANEIIIPTTAGIFAVKGIVQLNDTINTVQKYCNKQLKIAGILITKFNPRVNINKDIKALTTQLSEQINVKIYNTYIRSSVVVEEAQAMKKDIFSYAADSTVANDYNSFIDEYLGG